MESFIYSHIDLDSAIAAGYFEPKAEFKLLDHLAWWVEPTTIVTRYSQVIYFPGAFGTFHEGHVSVCKAALEKYPDAVLVIAPSNSDYAVEKYGAWSELASNKHRYEAIKLAMPDALIDLDPMLNLECDHNFTDLLENFLNAHELSIDLMDEPPILLCGKDRRDFLRLNEYTKDKLTDKVIVEHFEDTTGLSTVNLPNKIREKKKLYLRCRTYEEANLFAKYFEDQYTEIEPIYLHHELEVAKEAAALWGSTHTICKEYAVFLPYIRLSRTFTNPLADPSFPEGNPGFTPDMEILDSDTYSGATKRFILSKGASLGSILDLEDAQDTHELLDISDFRKPYFCYPWVDISSRCSMQAFDTDFHHRYNAFREELKRA